MRPKQIPDEEVIAAARRVFLAEGPQASIATVAEAVGLSQAALFKRFGSKAELMFLALRPPHPPPFLGAIDAGPTDAPLPDQLRTLAEEVYRFFLGVVPCMMVIRSAGLHPSDILKAQQTPGPVLAVRHLSAWFDRAIASGRMRPLNSESAAAAFLGTLQMRAFWNYVSSGTFTRNTDDAYLDEVVGLLWRGMAPEASP